MDADREIGTGRGRVWATNRVVESRGERGLLVAVDRGRRVG